MRTAEIHGFVGPKGCGKTWRASQLVKKRPLVIFIDTAREFQGTIEPIYDYRRMAKVIGARDKRKKLHISYRAGENIDPQKAFEYAAAVSMSVDGECLVFANETGRLIPRNKPMSKITYKIVTMGRHYSAPLFWTAQKLTGVHRELRENADYIDFFKSNEFNARDEIKKIGGPDIIKAYEALEKYEFIQISQDYPPKKMKKTKKA